MTQSELKAKTDDLMAQCNAWVKQEWAAGRTDIDFSNAPMYADFIKNFIKTAESYHSAATPEERIAELTSDLGVAVDIIKQYASKAEGKSP